MTVNSRYSLALASAAAAFALAFCAPASAALGGTPDSISADMAAMQGTATSEQRNLYSILVMTLPDGTVVNEYLASGGTVFAVSWRGLRPPDLSQLLGAYYSEYQTAMNVDRTRAERRHILVNTGHMVFESGGHMRDLRGSAYVPELMPAGLTVGDLH